MPAEMNNKDPLAQNTEASRVLFQEFSKMSNGFTTNDVVNAALNILINAIRQGRLTREDASQVWDECVARSKGVLMDCYDSTGRKKGIYPYTQTLVLRAPITFKSKIENQ